MRKKKWTIKYLIGQIHLWLGLASGIIIVILGITGCLFVFQKEISEIIYKKTLFVSPQAIAVLPISELQQKAQAALGVTQPINFITTYKEENKAWEFMAYKSNDTAITYFGSIEYYSSVFINPYNGSVTGFRNYKYDFFNVVKAIHWSLLLSTAYGQPVIGYSVLIFVILLFTGIVLWWPKRWSKANRQQAFTIKWKARVKRLNYDLHNVLGFYSLLIALVIALTGMVMAFEWFEKTVYVVATQSTAAPKTTDVKSYPLATTSIQRPIDIAYVATLKDVPDQQRLGISPASGKESVLSVYAYKDKELYSNYDVLSFDQYSGRLLSTKRNTERNNGEKIIGMNYDIHVGAIAGLPGKTIAFIISLIVATLPVTGFFVWWNKRKKNSLRSI